MEYIIGYISGSILLLATVVFGQGKETCTMIYLSGDDSIAFPSDRGFYSLLNQEKHGRPVYMNDIDADPLFLYYDMYENNEVGYWFVSSNINSILTGTRASDNATYPEDISTSWEELYKNDEGNLAWKSSPTIKASCVDKGCESGQLLVGSMSENQHPLQLGIQGLYTVMEDLHNRRPIYRHDTNKWYIYYNENLNEDNTTFSYWAFSKEVASDQVSALSTVPAPDPAYVDSGWRIYSNTDEEFSNEPEFRSKCVSSDFEYCRSRRLELQIMGIEELDLLYIKDTIGIYEVEEGMIHNIRPVYKHSSGKHYLYYTWKEDIGVGYWTVGRALGSDQGTILFVIDHALRPEIINNKVWSYHFPVTATSSGEFRETTGIQLSCVRNFVSSDCGEDTCENGGTCVTDNSQPAPNITYCQCMDGYYGAHCEIEKFCEPAPLDIAHGSLWTKLNNMSYLTLVLYLCHTNYFSQNSEYFGICGDDGQWTSIPVCVENPTGPTLDSVHMSNRGSDNAICGNHTNPCQSLRYSLERVADSGTIFVHGIISDCGMQTISDKSVNLIGWPDTGVDNETYDDEAAQFNCGLGQSFITVSKAKLLIANLKISGAIINIHDSNEIIIQSSHMVNMAIQNYVQNSDQLTFKLQDVLWESDIMCHEDRSFQQFDLNGGYCVTSWSSITILPALTSILKCRITNTTFLNTMINIGSRKKTAISIEKSFFMSNDTKSKQFLNVIITNGKSSVNISHSVFQNMLLEDFNGRMSYMYAGLIIQEGGERKEESFVDINLFNNLFQNNTRGIMIEVTNQAKIVISNSSFLSNVGYGGGGAICITQGKINRVVDTLGIIGDILGLSDKGIEVDIINNTFEDNYAINYGPMFEYTGKGGAIFTDTKSQVIIYDSVFRNNTAEFGGSVFAGDTTSLILGNSNFITSKKQKSFLGEGVYATGFLFVSNITIIGLETSDNIPLLSYISSGDVSNYAHIKEINITCPINRKVHFRNSTAEYNPGRYNHIHYSCISCPEGTYSPYGASFWTSTDTNNDGGFAYDPNLIFNITFSTQTHNLSHADIQCLNCPYGGYCSKKGLMSKRNYWGYLCNDHIIFKESKPGYCCQEEVCDDYNTCADHHTGILCTDCVPGYSQTFWGTSCVPNYHCTNGWWIWFLVAAYGVIYIFILLMEYEFKSFIHNQARWFKEKLLKCNCCCLGNPIKSFPPAGQGNKEEHIERGLVRIFLYYMQVGLLLQLDILYKDDNVISHHTSNLKTSFNQILNFNVAPLHNNLCVSPGWEAISKLITQGCFIIYLFLVSAILYPVWFCVSKFIGTKSLKALSFTKRHLTESMNKPRPSINVRFIVLFVELLIFTYQAVAEVTLTSLDCVDIGGEYLLAIKTGVKCYQPWQFGMIALLIIYVVPLFVVMLLGPKSLISDILPWPVFIISCCFPIIFVILYPILYFKAKASKALNKKIQNSKSLNAVIADKINGPYQIKKNLCWEGVTVFQRLVLALVSSLVADILIRYFILALSCLLFLLMHIIFKPYKVSSSNSADVTSLLLLCVISLISLVKSVLYKAGIVPYGQLQSVFFVLEYLEFILLLVLPFIIVALVTLLCITFMFTRLCQCIKKTPEQGGNNYAPEDKKDEDISNRLQNSDSEGGMDSDHSEEEDDNTTTFKHSAVQNDGSHDNKTDVNKTNGSAVTETHIV